MSSYCSASQVVKDGFTVKWIFSSITDESTDIGVLNQLVLLVGRYVSNSGVKTSFFISEIL